MTIVSVIPFFILYESVYLCPFVLYVCVFYVGCSASASKSRSGQKGSLEDDVNSSPWIALQLLREERGRDRREKEEGGGLVVVQKGQGESEMSRRCRARRSEEHERQEAGMGDEEEVKDKSSCHMYVSPMQRWTSWVTAALSLALNCDHWKIWHFCSVFITDVWSMAL